MNKKITKKQSKQFFIQTYNLLLTKGAKPTENERMHQLELNTQYGDMIIRIEENNNFCYTVFSQFKEPERSKGALGSNPFSGKYNIHVSGQLHACIDAVNNHFKPLIQ